MAGMNVSASVRRRQLEAERPGRRIGGGRAGFWGGHFFHGHCVVGARKNCACKAKIHVLWVDNGPKRIGKARDVWARVVVFGWNVPAPAAG